MTTFDALITSGSSLLRSLAHSGTAWATTDSERARRARAQAERLEHRANEHAKSEAESALATARQELNQERQVATHAAALADARAAGKREAQELAEKAASVLNEQLRDAVSRADRLAADGARNGVELATLSQQLTAEVDRRKAEAAQAAATQLDLEGKQRVAVNEAATAKATIEVGRIEAASRESALRQEAATARREMAAAQAEVTAAREAAAKAQAEARVSRSDTMQTLQGPEQEQRAAERRARRQSSADDDAGNLSGRGTQGVPARQSQPTAPERSLSHVEENAPHIDGISHMPRLLLSTGASSSLARGAVHVGGQGGFAVHHQRRLSDGEMVIPVYVEASAAAQGQEVAHGEDGGHDKKSAAGGDTVARAGKDVAAAAEDAAEERRALEVRRAAVDKRAAAREAALAEKETALVEMEAAVERRAAEAEATLVEKEASLERRAVEVEAALAEKEAALVGREADMAGKDAMRAMEKDASLTAAEAEERAKVLEVRRRAAAIEAEDATGMATLFNAMGAGEAVTKALLRDSTELRSSYEEARSELLVERASLSASVVAAERRARDLQAELDEARQEARAEKLAATRAAEELSKLRADRSVTQETSTEVVAEQRAEEAALRAQLLAAKEEVASAMADVEASRADAAAARAAAAAAEAAAVAAAAEPPAHSAMATGSGDTEGGPRFGAIERLRLEMSYDAKLETASEALKGAEDARDQEAKARAVAEEQVEKLGMQVEQLEARLRGAERASTTSTGREGAGQSMPRAARLPGQGVPAPTRLQQPTSLASRVSAAASASSSFGLAAVRSSAGQLSDEDDELELEVLEDTLALAPAVAPATAPATAPAPPALAPPALAPVRAPGAAPPLTPATAAAASSLVLAPVAPPAEGTVPAPSPAPTPAQTDDEYYMQRARELKAKREAAQAANAPAASLSMGLEADELDDDQLSAGSSINFDDEVELAGLDTW